MVETRAQKRARTQLQVQTISVEPLNFKTLNVQDVKVEKRKRTKRRKSEFLSDEDLKLLEDISGVQIERRKDEGPNSYLRAETLNVPNSKEYYLGLNDSKDEEMVQVENPSDKLKEENVLAVIHRFAMFPTDDSKAVDLAKKFCSKHALKWKIREGWMYVFFGNDWSNISTEHTYKEAKHDGQFMIDLRLINKFFSLFATLMPQLHILIQSKVDWINK
jgi:hypothetical protein